MSEDFNPYAVENMPEGGGLTRDIVVTSAKYVIEPMKRKDGSAVNDDKGNQQYFIGLRIIGLSTDPRAEGKESKYDFSAGKKAKPSADGETLVDDSGKIAKVYKTSNLGKAINGLRAGGFDPAQLYPRVSALVGARLTLAGQDQKDKDGKVKTYTGKDGKSHNSIEWFPEKYNGHANGAALPAQGGGADLEAKAAAAVVDAIKAAGGSLERKDLFRALGAGLKGDPDATKITTLAARADFHTGKPWGFDGTTLTLAKEA